MTADHPRTWFLIRDAFLAFVRSWKPAAGYLAWFSLLDLAILAPLTAWVLEEIIRGTGQFAITNQDIAIFALSLRGAIFLLTTTVLYLVIFMIKVGGLTLLASHAHRGETVSLWTTIRACTGHVPAFLRLSLIQAGVGVGLLAVAALCLAGIKISLLSAHDINFYLSQKPPAWWVAVAAGLTISAAFAFPLVWISIRWLFAVPTLLLAGTTARSALHQSWRCSRGWTARLGTLLIGWWIGSAAVWSLLALLGHAMVGPLFNWAGFSPHRLLPMVAVITVLASAGSVAWGLLTLGIHQFVVTRLAIHVCHLPVTAGIQPTRPPNDGRSKRPSRRFGAAAWLGALILTLASTLTGWRMLENLNLVETVEITAHRGTSSQAPENTLAAFRQAIADGADYIELDVQTCADGTVVVLHDRDFMRVASDARRVEDLTLPELKGIDVGRGFSTAFEGEHPPTLTEVIELARGRVRLNIELKYNRPDPALVPAVLRILRAERFIDHCVVTSLNAEAVRQVKERNPAVRTGLIVTAAIGNVSTVEADFLSIASSQATPRAIRQAHNAGKQVHVWTVNDPLLMLRMIENQADNLITDKPALLKTVLEERARLSDSEKVALRLRTLFGQGIGVDPSTPRTEPGED